MSDYRFYDKRVYEKTDDSIRSLFVHYRWIKYNQNAAVGKHCVLDVELNDTVSWNLPKRYNRKNKYDGWGKGELAEIKSITNMIRSSYLYDDINSILKKHKTDDR